MAVFFFMQHRFFVSDSYGETHQQNVILNGSWCPDMPFGVFVKKITHLPLASNSEVLHYKSHFSLVTDFKITLNLTNQCSWDLL